MHRCSQRGRRRSGLEGLATPLHVGSYQLTRCFSAVAELLVKSDRENKGQSLVLTFEYCIYLNGNLLQLLNECT